MTQNYTSRFTGGTGRGGAVGGAVAGRRPCPAGDGIERSPRRFNSSSSLRPLNVTVQQGLISFQPAKKEVYLLPRNTADPRVFLHWVNADPTLLHVHVADAPPGAPRRGRAGARRLPKGWSKDRPAAPWAALCTSAHWTPPGRGPSLRPSGPSHVPAASLLFAVQPVDTAQSTVLYPEPPAAAPVVQPSK